jgi:hypothetical protein
MNNNLALPFWTNQIEKENSADILSAEQRHVYEVICSGRHQIIYVTGKAGTGKSTLLRYLVAHSWKSIAIVAPTGIAALNVGGVTIHSFFGFPPAVIEPQNIIVSAKFKKIVKNIGILLIDEVSMVRVDMMHGMDIALKEALGNSQPFGGLPIVMFGDLYQLPPVIASKGLHDYFAHTYGGVYFFDAPVFQDTPITIYELTTIYRQTDARFIELLNAIRTGNRSRQVLDAINSRVSNVEPHSGVITLATKNTTVAHINCGKLAELPAAEKIYTADIQGDLKAALYPTDEPLRLKVGAQVVMLKNDPVSKRWVNGSMGIITQLSDETIHVLIDGVEHSCPKNTWQKYRYEYNSRTRELSKNIVASFTQFPVRLAWAVTVHKAQGQTYASVIIDLSDGAFASGQTYVALSRCQSFDTLYLKRPVTDKDIIVDPEIISFMQNANQTLTESI